MKYYLRVLFLVIGVLALQPVEVDASIQVKADDTTTAAGASSFFDVFANVTGLPDNIAGWEMTIDLDPTAVGFIQFTGIGASTAPHLNVFVGLPGGDPFQLSLTTSSVSVTGFPNDPSVFASLDDQDGFVRVFYDVLPGAPAGTYDITLDQIEIVDNAAPTPNSLPFISANGSITVTGDNVIPEPASVFIWGGLIVGMLRRGRMTGKRRLLHAG